MKLILLIIISIALLSISLLAQEKSGTCPTITVAGPTGITRPGEIATFTASMDRQVPSNLTTRWIVEGAEIVRQTQFSVDVRISCNAPVTATIVFDGLPNGCPAKASESYEVICDPGAQKLGELSGPKYRLDIELLETIKSVLIEQPNSQIYVVLPMGLKMPKAISRQLAKNQIDPKRITTVNRDIKVIRFWLVPPGSLTTP